MTVLVFLKAALPFNTLPHYKFYQLLVLFVSPLFGEAGSTWIITFLCFLPICSLRSTFVAKFTSHISQDQLSSISKSEFSLVSVHSFSAFNSSKLLIRLLIIVSISTILFSWFSIMTDWAFIKSSRASFSNLNTSNFSVLWSTFDCLCW